MWSKTTASILVGQARHLARTLLDERQKGCSAARCEYLIVGGHEASASSRRNTWFLHRPM